MSFAKRFFAPGSGTGTRYREVPPSIDGTVRVRDSAPSRPVRVYCTVGSCFELITCDVIPSHFSGSGPVRTSATEVLDYGVLLVKP